MGPDETSTRPALLDIEQAGAYLGRNKRFVQRLVARRELAFYRQVRTLRFAVADLDDYLARCRVEHAHH